MELILLRHGKTAANLQKRYNGKTNDPLCKEGIAEARAARAYPQMEYVYVSPLLRARQTAEICFPNAEQIVVDGLSEMDFGDFEGRTAEDMKNDSDYRAWVEGDCLDVCPNGESIPVFAKRAAKAFDYVVRDAVSRRLKQAGVAVHGGVIMAVMDRFAHAGVPYFDWYVLNCGGFRVVIDEAGWAKVPGFVSYERFGETGDGQSVFEGAESV
jgi:alpha-ribazole phosphatase